MNSLSRGLALLLVLWSAPAAATEASAPEVPEPATGWEAEVEPGWSALVRPQAVRAQEPNLHPDASAIRYRNAGGRWMASAGARMFLWGLDRDDLGARATWSGFIELHNLRAISPVPWELFRAHVGFQLHLYSRSLEARLPGKQRVDVMLGWFHESDHAAATETFFRRMTIVSEDPLADEDILNANMSSFEFWEARVNWQLSLSDDLVRLQFTPLGRLYPRPLSWIWSQRHMRGTLAVQARASVRVLPRVRPYVGGVLERTSYKRGPDEVVFDNGYVDGPRRHVAAELGVDLWSPDGLVFSPHLAVEWSHGRGIDWFQDNGRRLVVGVRVTP